MINQYLVGESAKKQGKEPQALVDELLAKVDTSDATLKKDYDKQVADIIGTKNYEVSVISSKTEADANAVLMGLSEGKSWNEMVKKSQDATSKANNGKLGVFNSKTLNPDFKKFFDEGKVGEPIMKITKGPKYYDVYRVDSIKDPEVPSFDSIKGNMANAKKAKAINDYVEGLRKTAKIQMHNTGKSAPKKK